MIQMGNHDSSRYERKNKYKQKERIKRPKKIKLTKDPYEMTRDDLKKLLTTEDTDND